MSVQEVTIGNIVDFWRPFVGLENYRQVHRRPVVPQGLRQLDGVRRRPTWWRRSAIGLLVALFFSQQFPGAHFMRGVLLAAWMLPALVVGALWKWMFASDYGVVNFFLSHVPLIGGSVHWLSDPSLSLTVGDPRQHLVRHAVQHDPDRRRADRDPAGAL